MNDDAPQQHGTKMKSKGGLKRIWNAFCYSKDGLIEAVRHEHAFRQELFLVLPLLIAAVFLPVDWRDKALLASALLLVLIVELLNSAMEACVDDISLEFRPLAKRAKDMGSAAVLLSLLVAGIVWAAILQENFGEKFFSK